MACKYFKASTEVVIISALILALFLLFSCSESQMQNANETYRLTKMEKGLLCDGDIILRRGSGFISNLIVSSFKEVYPISHCGIVCVDGDSTWVVHSVAQEVSKVDGMQLCSIDEFVAIAIPNSILVTRFKSVDNSQMSKHAQRYLRKGLRFDYDFNPNDSSRIFCSELVRDAIRNSHNIDLLPEKGKSNIGFTAFYDSTYFDIILNHYR